MGIFSKILAFIRYILPFTKSTVKDLKSVLEAVEGGIEMMEKHEGYPFTFTKRLVKEAKDTA